MTITGIFSAVFVGLVLGVLGRLIAPGKQKIAIWLTILVGIAAAFVGTAIARGIGYADGTGWSWLEFFTQLVVAAVGVSLVAGFAGKDRRAVRN
ncbi:transglycosylase [Saccharomonospora sp. CUA-673]|uniref:GlsB/YeaQ/YmgE family stress response membrane protein n=1 Tax=Saccharomonospora sp. CUA-673 TaxID=1904969 RepID=UPI00096584E0|nr:transglycosylase [Saccharomonospora sp. CUA-673]OLT38738.1 transglycosylase [Saccharomonospora sp. CUA-673]